ncbi:hypothetical protein [Atlantibacter hermannii]|uniref:hypothetical protein n=1 Tax=Atlantibacter hermannii TaxID=565 RepID=UPI00289A7DF9|nr:hypothetical protein [Atlantibacter hermannii]
MKDMTHEQLIRATYVVAKFKDPETAKLLNELAGRLDCALVAARTACLERDAAVRAEIEWETTMHQATGADSVDDVVSVIEKLKSDLADMASENLTLKESTKNGVIEPHQMTSRGVSIGVKNVIVNREIKTPATDAFCSELRAQGADECVRQLVISDDDYFSDAPNVCAMVAHQLRGNSNGGAL